MPLYTQIPTAGPAPLEGDPEDWLHGAAARAGLAFEGGLGVTGLERLQAQYAEGPWIGHDEAAQEMQQAGYPSDGIPQAGLTRGALDDIMGRQSNLRVMSNQAARSNVGTVGGFVAGLVGGTPDPVNAGLLIAAPELRLPEALAASRVARAAAGAAEGAAYGAATTYGQEALGHPLGDEDVTTADNLRSVLLGTAVGGGLHVAFGGRAPVVVDRGAAPLTLGDVAQLERTAAFARAHGIPENEVVSSAGAVGRYQVTPGTAQQFGFDPGDLKNPETNANAAQAILDDLQHRFPNDPEAQAVGYIAGPGAAQKWIAAGRDMGTLGPNTRDYVARLQAIRSGARIEPQGEISQAVDDLPPQTRMVAAQTAVAQFAADSPVNVDPVLTRSILESGAVGETRPLFAGPYSDIGSQRLSEAYLRRFGGDVAEMPKAADEPLPHQPADWADFTPTVEQGGPASPISMRDSVLRAAARGLIDLEPEPLIDAVPKPGSILTEDPQLLDRLGAMKNIFGDQGRPAAPTAEAQQHLDAAVEEASHAARYTNPELAQEMQDSIAAHDEDMGEASSFVKAVQTAVRCGMAKGFL